MALGFALTAFALWLMTRMTLDMDSDLVMISGVIQGLGIGFTFVPLSTATFATLARAAQRRHADLQPAAQHRRRVGISIVQALLDAGRRARARRAGDRHRARQPRARHAAVALDPATPGGLALLNGEVTRQAAMIAYLGDFRFMLALTLLSMPLLLLIRKAAPPRRRRPEGGTGTRADRPRRG
jgi:DHA2 family multidrug resistance protein